MFDEKVKRIFLCRDDDGDYRVSFFRKDGEPEKDSGGWWELPDDFDREDWEEILLSQGDMLTDLLPPGEMVELTQGLPGVQAGNAIPSTPDGPHMWITVDMDGYVRAQEAAPVKGDALNWRPPVQSFGNMDLNRIAGGIQPGTARKFRLVEVETRILNPPKPPKPAIPNCEGPYKHQLEALFSALTTLQARVDNLEGKA